MPRLGSNWRSSCLSLPVVGLTGLQHPALPAPSETDPLPRPPAPPPPGPRPWRPPADSPPGLFCPSAPCTACPCWGSTAKRPRRPLQLPCPRPNTREPQEVGLPGRRAAHPAEVVLSHLLQEAQQGGVRAVSATHEEGNHCFAVRPAEFHVPLELREEQSRVAGCPPRDVPPGGGLAGSGVWVSQGSGRPVRMGLARWPPEHTGLPRRCRALAGLGPGWPGNRGLRAPRGRGPSACPL